MAMARLLRGAAIAIGLLAFILSPLASCSRSSKLKDGNLQVFHTSYLDDIKSLDPVNTSDIYSTEISSLINESLYQYSYLDDPYKVVPLLAADMPKVSKDQLTVMIPIRKKVFFQDHAVFKKNNGKGREITAHDFIYSWKRLADPRLHSNGWWIFDGKIKGLNDFHELLSKADKKAVSTLFLSEKIVGIQALDDYTIQIKLTKPFPNLIYILCMNYTAVVPHEAVEVLGDSSGNITETPVGSGPFVLKSWERNYKIVLEKNQAFHTDFYPATAHPRYRAKGLLADAGKPLPFLDRVVIDIVRETQPTWLNFISGKFDRLTLAKDNFQNALDTNFRGPSEELKAKGIGIHVESTGWFYYIAFGQKDPLLKSNKYLRQALSSAIDRKEWVKLFTQNQGIVAYQYLPPGVPDRPLILNTKYDFNRSRAKELLKKAGYPGGKGLPTIKMDMRGADSISRQLGDFFTSQFSAVGVNIEVIYNTFPAFLEKSKTGSMQMYLGGWVMDYPDAENVWQLLYSGNVSPGPNDSSYSNPKMDKWYEKLSTMQAGPARKALLKEMDDFAQEECPWALGYYLTAFRLTQPWLKNYRYSDMILNGIKYLKIDRAEKKKRLP